MGLASEGALKRNRSGPHEPLELLKGNGTTGNGRLVSRLGEGEEEDAVEQNFNKILLPADMRKISKVTDQTCYVPDAGCSDEKTLPLQGKDKSLNIGPPKYRSQRYILGYILFVGMMNCFYQRICFSIAIICMVNHTAISTNRADANYNNSNSNQIHTLVVDKLVNASVAHTHNVSEGMMLYDNMFENISVSMNGVSEDVPAGLDSGAPLARIEEISTNADNVNDEVQDGVSEEEKSEDEFCEAKGSQDTEANEDGPLEWDKPTQGLLLGAIYWTYMLLCVPSIFFIERYRKKDVVLLSMSLLTLMTLLTHGASLLSPWLVFLIKLIQGASTAFAMIAMYSMWAKWAPPQERATLLSMCFSGSTLANATVFPLSGLLCKYGLFGGWPSVFYFFGVLCVLWLFLLWFLTEEGPSEHPRISNEERDYINSSFTNRTVKKKPHTPWFSILTSVPVWALIVGQTSFTWGLFLFLSTLPQYMLEILKMDIKSNGLYSMFPYLAFFLICQVAGRVSDFVIQRKLITVLWTRKLCCIISNIIPAVLVIVISFLNCTQPALAIILLSLSVGATGFAFSYILVNPFDIAPAHAGSVIALSNSIAMIPGIVTPYFVASITKDKTREQWQIVFFVTAAILVAGTLGYCLLGSSHIQPWAGEKDTTIVIDSENDEIDTDCKYSPHATDEEDSLNDNEEKV